MDIMNFKESLVNFSTEELKNMKKELQDGITKMIMDNDPNAFCVFTSVV